MAVEAADMTSRITRTQGIAKWQLDLLTQKVTAAKQTAHQFVKTQTVREQCLRTVVLGNRSGTGVEQKWNRSGTGAKSEPKVEQKWNRSGTGVERKWNGMTVKLP